ncbi:hypothetical protein [Cohnella fermenti]|uniref:Uncharacterized protein n=1 Tax=Cohnella fermenti TaxID=2565925 RepID=A0A4V3WEL9_9BACL|nr:hypothetical protein [Cohnella fermenti]THF76869.1 hypothetical protein E6C55_17545 [Cohnella fermenti]
MDYVRDYAMYASVFGLFSMAWFGWAQENPRSSWRIYLGIGASLGLLVCLIGVYLSVTHWDGASALNDSDSFRAYLIAFYAEFAIGAIGSYFWIRRKRHDFVAPWIAFIVGIHFIALKDVFQDSGLYVLSGLLIAASLFSPFIARRMQVASSAITGIAAGSSLFLFAILGLIRFSQAV